MITRVRLRNWKSHADTELRLGDGTNLLVGGMGSGKSSVLEAISMGLFGTVPGLRERGLRLEDLIRNRPEPSDSAEVEVGFLTPEGEEYVVRRVIRRKGATFSELRRADGQVVETESSQKVTERVEKLLGVSYELFERAIYSQQNRLDYFLSLRPSERRKKIDELMGMDKLEEARQRLGTLSRRLAREAEERGREVREGRREELLEQLRVLEEEMREGERRLEELRRRELELSSRVQELGRRLEEMEGLRRRLEELRRRAGEEEARMRELGRRLEEVEAGLGGPPRLEELEREAKEAEEAYAGAVRREEELGARLAEAEGRAGSLRGELKTLRDREEGLRRELREKEEKERELRGLEGLPLKLEEVRAEGRRLREELARVEARQEEVRRGLEELSRAGPVCPVCETPLGEEKKEELRARRQRELQELERRREELEEAKRELEEEERRLQGEERRMRRLEGEVAGLSRLRGELEEVVRRREERGRELEALERELGNLREEHRKARRGREEAEGRRREALERWKLGKEFERLQRELREIKLRHLKLRREVWGLEREYREEEERRTREEYQVLSSELGRIRGELGALEKLVEERRGRAELLGRELRELRRKELESLRLREASEALSLLQQALQRTQAVMRFLFVQRVNELMEDLWAEVYPYGDYTSLRLSVGEGGDYEFELRDRRGNWLSVEGVASGGERTDACFVMRVALALALAPKLGWIALDEPTHNLDAEAIQELARVLRERLPSLVRQVLLITHEERLEAAVSGYLYRFHRDKEREGPTVVEQVPLPPAF